MSGDVFAGGESWHPLQLMRMVPEDVPDVVAIEYAVYPFPWTVGNFLDSIKSGYESWILRDARHQNRLLAYFLMMQAVDESHLLNITVHPDHSGRGLGRTLLDKVTELARASNMHSVLLEVRPSNIRALQIYLRYGFTRIGVRRNYYPAADNQREDAIVMRLSI